MILAIGLAAALAASNCVTVDGDQILGSHLAEANPVFSALPPDTVIGFAPRPGVVRTFAAGDLARLALRYHLGATPERGACFERAAQRLDKEKILAAMTRALANPAARIEIVEVAHYAVPRGEIGFPLSGLSAPAAAGPARGIARWRGFVRDSAGRKTSVWARVKVSAPITQVVAVQALKAGEPVGASQVKVETRESFPLTRSGIAGVEQALGCKPRRTIPAGTVLEPGMLEEPNDVERGAQVETEVRSGAVVLKMDAIAETSGRRGDRVVVKNPTSGKKFSARVAGKNKVVVHGS